MEVVKGSRLFLWSVLLGVVNCSPSTQVACPGDAPCTCHTEQHENSKSLNIKCRGEDTKEGFPNLSAYKGLPISKLDLSANNVGNVEDDIFEGLLFEAADKAKEPQLILDKNPLRHIARHAFRGMTFKALSLSMNECNHGKIPLIPLRELRQVTGLHMKLNSIDNIPSNAFAEFNRLQTLTLSDNVLGTIKEETFAGLEDSLRVIDLSRTALTKFPSNILKKYKKLSHVSLDENPIKAIPSKALSQFVSESSQFELSLSGTGDTLLDIAPDAFLRDNTSLQIHQLFLINNKLKSVDFLADPCSSVFRPGKTKIFLHENEIECDCNLYEIAETGFFNLDGDCGGPTAYKGIRFDIKTEGYQQGPLTYSAEFGTLSTHNCSTLYNGTSWNLSCLSVKNEVKSTEVSASTSTVFNIIYGLMCLLLTHFTRTFYQ